MTPVTRTDPTPPSSAAPDARGRGEAPAGAAVAATDRARLQARRRAAAETDLLRASRDLRRAHQEIDALAATCDGLRAELAAERDRSGRAERRAEQLGQRADAARIRSEALERRSDALETRANALEEAAREAVREARDWKRRAEDVEGRVRTLEAETLGLASERDRAREELAALRATRLVRLAAAWDRLTPRPVPSSRDGSPAGTVSPSGPGGPASAATLPAPGASLAAVPPAPEPLGDLGALPEVPPPLPPLDPEPPAAAREAPAARLPWRGAAPEAGRPGLADVVCFSIIEWDFLFQRPQQLLSRLAERGHRVFHVSAHQRSPDAGPRLYRARERVFEVLLGGTLVDLFREEPTPDDLDALARSFGALREAAGVSDAVLLVHHPFWWPVVERVRSETGWALVYDCMDHHSGFQTNLRPVEPVERELVAGADLVLTSSRLLQRELDRPGRPVVLLPNGADADYFESVAPRLPLAGRRPVVGYFGAIADWFDPDLVADLACGRPGWEFQLAGPVTLADPSRLSRLANVRFLGLLPYGELVPWLDGVDVLLLPFRRTRLTEATNPVKAYEILSAGRPLVSVPLPELSPFAGLVRFADDAAGFDREVAAALEEDDPGLVEARRAFARRHSWDERAAELAARLAALARRPAGEA